MALASCSFCRAQVGCTLALTHPFWGELLDAAKLIGFSKGNMIYREGFPAEGIFLLCHGSVKLIIASESGTDRIAGFVTCGELFGLDALLCKPFRCMSAVAREASQAAFIRSADFKKALQSNTDLLWTVMLMLNDLFHRANNEKVMISGMHVRERVQSVLLDLSERLKESEIAGKPTFAALKQRELAELLGIPEETICRELRKIRNENRNRVTLVRDACSEVDAL